jgi:hypothetical protein
MQNIAATAAQQNCKLRYQGSGSRKSVFVTGFWSTYGYNDSPLGMLRALERNFGQSIAPSGYCGSDYWENAQDQDSLGRSASGQDHSVSSS